MGILVRLALTFILTNVTVFCCLMSLDSFERSAFLVSGWLYGAATVACIIAIVAVWLVKRPRG